MVSGIAIERVRAVSAAAAKPSEELIGEICADAEQLRQDRAHERAIRRNTGNVKPRCTICGSFKSRPSDICPGPNCGDHPLPHNASDQERVEYDQARGWYEPGGAM